MSSSPNALPDPSATPDALHRPRLYTPGVSNHLGDRLLTFDNGTASSLELLKFKIEFSTAPGFEAALRKRVDDFGRFRHPSVAPVRGVEWMGDGDGLALVSIHTAGRRLSEILKDARGATFAFELLRQLGPALVALQQCAPGIAHGAITPERVIVTREGRLVLVEHVLGAALDELKFPAARVRAELGLAAPNDAGPIKFTPRLDVMQLAFVSLSLLLGRRLDAAEYPANIMPLLDEFTRTDAAGAARLRPWLERALQTGARPFASAQDAMEAFSAIPEAPVAAPVVAPARPVPAPPVPSQVTHFMSADAKMSADPKRTPTPPAAVEDTAMPNVPPAVPTQWHSGRAFRVVKWTAAALALLVVGEGLVIAGLFTRPASVVIAPAPPRAEVLATSLPAVITIPPPATPDAAAPAPTTAKAADGPAPAPATPKTDATADRPAPAGSRFGGVKVASPIELQVFESNALLGSNGGPIAINEGPHLLELVNDALGFRYRQSVTVKAGQMSTINIAVPDGRISINAVPWADVVIDGTPAGQTPIANLSLKIGQHEIVFRHPQLGEQKQTVTVKVEGLTRVSAVLQK